MSRAVAATSSPRPGADSTNERPNPREDLVTNQTFRVLFTALLLGGAPRLSGPDAMRA